MTVVIGTAGHIDHGKTTLLRALTGIDADRLPEERARGMTIDVGYAHLELDDGTELDFVDVPGHDRLVGNMLVGAGEIDAALLVVAADDGPRAQTLEHLELLDALAIEDGLGVVTKADSVTAERLDEVVDGVRALLARTGLAAVEVLPASAVTGQGLDDVRRGLTALQRRVQAAATADRNADHPEADRRADHRDAGHSHADRDAPPSGGVRLAVDRVFAIRGRGTVATGTLRGGGVRAGALLRAVPGAPDVALRIREVQVHGRTRDVAGPGRVALNVAGDASRDLRRGVVLTNDPAVVATDRVLVALRPVAALDAAAGPGRSGPGRSRQIPDRARVVVHAGTDHVSAVVGRGGRESVTLTGGEATAVLRLERAVALRPGDRFALRRPSPPEPLGGGRVLDPVPPRGLARRRATEERLLALASAEPSSPRWAAARLDLHGVAGDPPRLAADVASAIEAAIVAGVGVDGARRAELVRIGDAALRRSVGSGARFRETSTSIFGRLIAARLDDLVATGTLERDGDRLRLPGASRNGPSPELLAAMDRLVDRIAVVAPPPLAAAARDVGCPAEGIRELERTNRIVKLDDDLAWAFSTYRDLAGRAVRMAGREPLTPAAYRDATGTSRKYVLAILEDLDRRAILTRTPAGHIPGPRAPRQDALPLAPARADASTR